MIASIKEAGADAVKSKRDPDTCVPDPQKDMIRKHHGVK